MTPHKTVYTRYRVGQSVLALEGSRMFVRVQRELRRPRTPLIGQVADIIDTTSGEPFIVVVSFGEAEGFYRFYYSELMPVLGLYHYRREG